MEMLWNYALTGNLTNQNAGYSMWGFARKDGKDFFVKQFLAPKYPSEDTVSSPERLQRKKAACEKFVQNKRKIYSVVNTQSDGNDVRICEFFRVKTKYYISMEKIIALPWEIATVAALDIQETRRLCSIIAHSVAALHRGGLVHADLKHENILFTKTDADTVTAKITDFDSAFLESEPPGEGEDIVGDWVYFSPEVWGRMKGAQMKLSCKMDVFALGVLFHQYFTGELPYFDHNQCSAAGQAALMGQTLGVSDEIPEEIASLLREMLSQDPDKRPTAQEVFQRMQPASARLVAAAQDAYREPAAPPAATAEARIRFCSACGARLTGGTHICNPRPGTPNSSKADDNFFFIPTDLS